MRENICHMFGTLGMDVSPGNARKLLDLISREASGLKMLYSADFFDGLLKRMAERGDEMWSHDYLSADFKAEYSDVVMGRLGDLGFDFIASLLIFWTDLMIAATRIAPFLPEMCVLGIDRQQLRNLNRQRLADAMEEFSAKTSTTLLASALGNCIDVGWFETLVLHHFHHRHDEQTQGCMLEALARAHVALGGPDGQVSGNQAAALRGELAKLEQGYLSRLQYWGVEL